MRFAAVQFEITWEDKAANHERIARLLDEADVAPGTFVLLPEMADTGFSFNLDRIVDDQSVPWGREFARRKGVWLQIGYARLGDDGRGRNCATIISPDGAPLATYEKVFPFGCGGETALFAGGEQLVVCGIDDAPAANQATAPEPPSSVLLVAPFICYDLRFPELWRIAAAAGAEVFTIGANWPAARQQHWRSLLIARAIENQAWVVGVNRVGNDPHLSYGGGSMVISPKGEVIAEASDKETVLQADLDLDVLHEWRRSFPALADMRHGLLGRIDIRRAGAVSGGDTPASPQPGRPA